MEEYVKDKIAVTVATDLNHTYECPTDIIGREGEGNVSRLEITIPAELCDYAVYIDFKKPSGETIRTPQLEVESGVAKYDVPLYILSESGELKVQLVFQHSKGMIWKSSKKKYFIQKSINALDDVPEGEREDFMSEAQNLINQLNGEVSEIAEKLSNDQDFVDSVIRTMETPTYVKTIDGRILKFFFGTQAQYNSLSDYETSNLFAIITDDPTKDTIFSRLDALNATDADFAGEIEDLKNDVDRLDTHLSSHAQTIVEIQRGSAEFWQVAPSYIGITPNAYLDRKGYYLIQAEIDGRNQLFNFGMFYYDGVHTCQASTCDDIYIMRINADGEVWLQNAVNNDHIYNAKIYARKFEGILG